jgi:ParB family transcriptional regulator, chromosome partitioning protein
VTRNVVGVGAIADTGDHVGEAPVPKTAKTKSTAKKTTKKKTTRRKKAEPASRGLQADALPTGDKPDAVAQLEAAIADDGGAVLATYRDPLGARWTILAGLPIDKVEPTPFQRDLSATHVKRLTEVIDKLDRFLDPIVAVRTDGKYWTPNGNHRLNAVRNLGGKSIVALVVPDAEVAYKILALNTEKAHNIREKALEVIRMARSLAEIGPRPESEFEVEFEEPALVTLGACYEQNGRFSGGAYNPVLKRVEAFLELPLPQALEIREARAAKLLELDEAVGEAVKALKERGFDSPYLKAFVLARINPLRFKRGAEGDFDEVIDAMHAAASSFDVSKVRADQLAKSGGGGASED